MPSNVPAPTDDAALLAAFGVRVRQLRTERQFSQESLALRAGLDRSYVGQVERGERNIALVNIVKLASGLGVPASELLAPVSIEGREAG